MVKKYLNLFMGLFCLCSISYACSNDESLTIPPEIGGSGYENDNEITGEKDIQIKVLRASGSMNNKVIEEDKLKESYDNDRNTVYRGAMGKYVASFYYEFDGEEIMDYCVYYPYPPSGGYYAAWGEVEVQIQEKGDPAYKFTTVAQKDLGFANLPATFYFEGKKRITGVKFVVKTGQQNWAGISEIQFFRRVKPVFDALTLFKDETCSDLKDGITEKEINSCEEPFYRTMALAMLNNTYPRLFRIQEFQAYPHPTVHAKANLTNGFTLYENVTGISVKGGDKLTVFVGDIPAGEFVSLKVLDWQNRENSTSGIYPLLKGFNQIKMDGRGLVYLTYHSENYQTLPSVKVHFATGDVNGYFDIARHTKEQWNDIINNAKYDLFDMVGKRSHITFATSDFKTYCSDPFNLMEVYDEMVDLEEDFTGMKKYGRTLTNRMYVHYHNGTGGAMSAAENHINWNNSKGLSIPTAVTADKLRREPWGLAHELGHELQLRPGRQRYEGMLEVTNNLLSIYVQLTINPGSLSRLYSGDITSSSTGHYSEFERAMTYYQAERRPHNYNMNGVRTVLTKLIPLWQLYLYFHEVLGKDWFKDYYQELLTQEYVGENGAAQIQLVRIFCDISKLNLLDFFNESGFLTATNDVTDKGETTKFLITENMIREVRSYVENKHYPKPDVAFWRITDQEDNIQKFRAKQRVTAGTYKRNDRIFTITGCQNAVVYEVYNNGKLVYVSPHSEFKVPDGDLSGTVVVRAAGVLPDDRQVLIPGRN